MRAYSILFIMLLGMSPTLASGTQYFFSDLGSDQLGNGSQASPWRSINKLNSLDLEPGDNVFFRAGDIFHGSMYLSPSDSGTSANGELIAPITIGSYGGAATDRAVIQSNATSAAIDAFNNGGIELKNLELVNGGSYASNGSSGIQFRLDQSASAGLSHYQHIRIDNVVSHGFHRSGLAFDASGTVGFQDVEVTNCQFYENQFAGVEIGAAQWTELIHRDIHIDGVVARDNAGYSGCNPHCGHGIVLGQVDGAVVENSTAYSNGVTAGKGNVGIWAWQSNDVVIQGNSAYGNRSPLGGDGGGFDIDGGVTNSIVQYNTSHDNAGAGYLLAQFESAELMQQNVFRYNLSVDDGTDGYGGITIAGSTPSDAAASALIHNNTVVVDRSAAPSSRGPVWFANEYHSDIHLINNAFVALNGAALMEGGNSVDLARFVNNAYWTADGAIQIGGATFASIADWSAVSQQEVLNGQFVGIEADPTFDTGGNFRPVPPSQLIDAGIPVGAPVWPAWFVGLGVQDLYGIPLPPGAGVDVGAAEYPLLAGDYNGNGVVDSADYTVWRDALGIISKTHGADGDRNGVVDGGDYQLWQMRFGELTSSPHAFWADSPRVAVPEPSSPALAVLLLLGFGTVARVRPACG